MSNRSHEKRATSFLLRVFDGFGWDHLSLTELWICLGISFVNAIVTFIEESRSGFEKQFIIWSPAAPAPQLMNA